MISQISLPMSTTTKQPWNFEQVNITFLNPIYSSLITDTIELLWGSDVKKDAKHSPLCLAHVTHFIISIQHPHLWNVGLGLEDPCDPF